MVNFIPSILVSLFLALSVTGGKAQTGQLPPNDDGSSSLIPLGFTFRLFGTDYNALYVNNNGNLTFSSPLSTYTPYAFPSSIGYPMIAPFFADVDTRNGKGTVSYEGTADYFKVSWNNVGYYSAVDPGNLDTRNTFSVTLQKNWGIIFQYGPMNWTTGDASDGSGGFGGAPATLGLDQGDGVNAVVFRRYDDNSVSQLQGTIWYFQTDKAVLDITPYKQCTDPWGSMFTLNSGSESMCNSGCFVTSTAMLLHALGHNTDPEKLNVFLRDFMSGGTLDFNSIPQDRIFFGQTDNVPGPKVRFRNAGFVYIRTPPPLPPDGDTNLRDQILTQLGSAINTYGPVIMRIPSRNYGTSGYLSTHTHAGLVYGVSPTDILIHEPGWAASPTVMSGYVDFVNNYLSAHNHQAWELKNADGNGDGHDFSWLANSHFTFTEILTPFSKQIIQGQANSPVEFVVTDPQGRRLGYDPVSGTKYNEIPGSSYFRDLDVAPALEGLPLVPTEKYKPLIFEIGDFIEGKYDFKVFGIDNGAWSIQFGVSDPIQGFKLNQFHQLGTASQGSLQTFSRVVTHDLSTPPDQTPPVVACSVTPELLWPPNHKMVNASITIEAQDDTSLPQNLVLIGATLKSNEPDNFAGDGDTKGDCNGQDGFSAPVDVTQAFQKVGVSADGKEIFQATLALRAERAAGSTGRIYTIDVEISDEAGNTGNCKNVVVVVPNQGVDLSDPNGTFARVGSSTALGRVFSTNRHLKYPSN